MACYLRHGCLFAAIAVAALPFAAAADTCQGGSAAVCECLLSADIFGGNADGCHSTSHDPNAVVADALSTAMQNSKSELKCEGIGRVVTCAKKLQCLDSTITARCLNIQKDAKGCKIDCSSAWRAGGAPSLALLAVACGLAVGLFHQ
eukprot:TRINITY_DN11462_c0_g2_i1.p2 TRINITY_DN11462_c0_g2~~TRINITY_DN11462_c0_g2_i1.p2  ORF type:complete len:147 (-),score=31.17 TRINITY_DN11462_c0_g2_i1:162-602(-)